MITVTQNELLSFTEKVTLNRPPKPHSIDHFTGLLQYVTQVSAPNMNPDSLTCYQPMQTASTNQTPKQTRNSPYFCIHLSSFAKHVTSQ